jgi:hypothetical protein
MLVLFEEFLANAEWVIGGVPHPEHPLVASNGADRLADLVRQGLERELMIGGCEGGANPIGWTFLILNFKKYVDGFLEMATEEVFVTIEGNRSGVRGWKPFREVKAMNGLEEKDGPDTMVKVVRGSTKGIQFRAFLKKCVGVEGSTSFRQWTVTGSGILCGDE